MDVMGSSKPDNNDSAVVARSAELVDRFLDAIWMERGLSQNTLGAYRADLMTLGRSLAESDKAIDKARKSDLLDFIAQRVESGAKPRSGNRRATIVDELPTGSLIKRTGSRLTKSPANRW